MRLFAGADKFMGQPPWPFEIADVSWSCPYREPKTADWRSRMSVRAGSMGSCESETEQMGRPRAQALDRGRQEAAASQRARHREVLSRYPPHSRTLHAMRASFLASAPESRRLSVSKAGRS